MAKRTDRQRAAGARPVAPPAARWGTPARRRALKASPLLFLAIVASAFLYSRYHSTTRSSVARPNVLLVTLDTTRADRIGCYGYPRAQTPRLDRLAAEGVRFEDATSPAPITFAAHSSIFTGLYPFEHGARGNGEFYLADRFDTLATRLRAAGYHTAAFVSSFVLDRRYGLARGFDTYDDRLDTNAAQIVDVEAERRGDRTVAVLTAWLDAHVRDRSAPFFAWLHLYDPHTPYTAPSPFAERFADSPYDGEIAFDDMLVGSVLDKLGELGVRNDTLVVVAGDHGESLGDHGEETHSMFVYESAIRVPLIAWKPGTIAAGAVVREPVRLTDIAPTILDLLAMPPIPTGNGRTLAPAIKGEHLASAPVYAETLAPQLNMNWAPLRSLRDERWKFIDAPRPELYDLRQDPGEQNNLASSQPQRAGALADALARVAGADRGALSRASVDAETRGRLAALGYIGAGSGAASPVAGGTARDPKDFIAVYNRLNRASRASREKRFDEALPILQEVLAKDPDNPFGEQTLGDVYMGLHQDRKAIEHYRRYLNLVPPVAYVHHLVAVCQLRLREPAAALEEATAALAIDPKFTDARILRATVLGETGRHEAAIAEFRAAIANDPSKPLIRLDLAKALVEAGRDDEARGEYEAVLRVQPRLAPALADLGALYMKQGRTDDARATLQRAIEIDPSMQEARFNLATLDAGQGRTAEALAGYRALLQRPDTSPDLRRAAGDRLRQMSR